MPRIPAPRPPDPLPAVSARELLPAAAVALATMAFAYVAGPKNFHFHMLDEYVWMIERGPSAADAPYAFRVLVPGVIRLLHLPAEPGLRLVAWVSTLLLLLSLHVLLRALGFSRRTALVTVAFAGLSYPVAVYLTQWGAVDPTANWFLVLALIGLVGRRWALAALATCLCTLTRETGLILVPLLGWRMWRFGARGAWARTGQALLVAAPVAVAYALRLVIDPLPGRFDPRSGAELMSLWRNSAHAFAYRVGLVRPAADLFRAYGFFLVTGALGLRYVPRWRGACVYLLGSGLALCAVAVDWSRMLGIGFVGVFLPTAGLLERLRPGRRTALLLAAGLVLAALQCRLSLLKYLDLPRRAQLLAQWSGAAVFGIGGLGAWLAARGATGARIRA